MTAIANHTAISFTLARSERVAMRLQPYEVVAWHQGQMLAVAEIPFIHVRHRLTLGMRFS